jgi:hypothetical protein
MIHVLSPPLYALLRYLWTHVVLLPFPPPPPPVPHTPSKSAGPSCLALPACLVLTRALYERSDRKSLAPFKPEDIGTSGRGNIS